MLFNCKYVSFITFIHIIKLIGIVKSLDGLFTGHRNMSTEDHIMQSSCGVKKKSQSWKLALFTEVRHQHSDWRTQIRWFGQDTFYNNKRTFRKVYFWYYWDCFILLSVSKCYCSILLMWLWSTSKCYLTCSKTITRYSLTVSTCTNTSIWLRIWKAFLKMIYLYLNLNERNI